MLPSFERFSTAGRRIAGAAALSLLMAPSQFEQGYTYRIRMTTRMPSFGGAAAGGAAGGPMVLARASSLGGRARIEFQAIEPSRPGQSFDDYVIVDDSGSVFTVNPGSRTYSEGSVVLSGMGGIASAMGGRGGGMRIMGGGGGGDGGRGRGGGGGGAAGGGGDGGAGSGTVAGRGMLEGFQVRDVKIEVEKRGAGEPLDGRPTQHYMIGVEYSVMIGQQLRPLSMTIELWTANLPVQLVNPFDPLGTGTYDMSGPTVELSAKLNAARRQLEGVPVRSVTTISLTELMGSMNSPLGGGGMGGMDISALLGGVPLDIVQTVQLTGITPADIDPKELQIPEGFTRR